MNYRQLKNRNIRNACKVVFLAEGLSKKQTTLFFKGVADRHGLCTLADAFSFADDCKGKN